MIIGLGTDIIAIERFANLLEKFEERSLQRLFTPIEQERAAKSVNPVSVYAKRFAAKEALVKALGTGLAQGISWQDIEVSNLESGKPVLKTSGKAEHVLKHITPTGFKPVLHLSLSDTDTLAQATVIIEAIQL